MHESMRERSLRPVRLRRPVTPARCSLGSSRLRRWSCSVQNGWHGLDKLTLEEIARLPWPGSRCHSESTHGGRIWPNLASDEDSSRIVRSLAHPRACQAASTCTIHMHVFPSPATLTAGIGSPARGRIGRRPWESCIFGYSTGLSELFYLQQDEASEASLIREIRPHPPMQPQPVWPVSQQGLSMKAKAPWANRPLLTG